MIVTMFQAKLCCKGSQIKMTVPPRLVTQVVSLVTVIVMLHVPFQALQDDGLNPDEVTFTPSDKTATTITPVKPTTEGKTQSLLLHGYHGYMYTSALGGESSL